MFKQYLPFQTCPRCKSTFVTSEILCHRCGFQLTQSASVAQPAESHVVKPQFIKTQSKETVEPRSVEMQPVQSQFARLQPVEVQAVQTSPSHGGNKDQFETKRRNRRTLLYFASVFLVLLLIVFLGLRSAGVSISTFTALNSGVVISPTAGYSLPKVAPLFADSFVNDVSGWNLQSSPGNYAVAVESNALSMQVDKNKLLWELVPGEVAYGDFMLGVDAVLAKGDQNNGYGVYIRGSADANSDLATYYRFELYGDGSYAIFKGIADQGGRSTAAKIVNYTLSSAIQKQGGTNHIMIIAKGPSLSFVVNGQLLKTFSDRSYVSGSVALFASNLPEARPGMRVQFSQLVLYPVQVAAPA